MVLRALLYPIQLSNSLSIRPVRRLSKVAAQREREREGESANLRHPEHRPSS